MPNYQSTYIAKDTDIDKVIEIFGGLLHQLNYIMNNMDSKNVKRINTNSTSIKSADGSTELNGSQLVMYDEDGVKRVSMGKNARGVFDFVLYDTHGNQTLRFDAVTGNATFSGDIIASDISGSTITGSTINVDTDIHVGDNAYIGDEDDENGEKTIQFFASEYDSGKGTITVEKDNSPSHATTLTIKANKIILSAFEGIQTGNGDDIITESFNSYVTINGTDYPVNWR